MENYEVRIREKLGTFLVEIFIYRREIDNKIGVLLQDKDGKLIEQRFSVCDPVPPSLVLPENVVSLMMEAFSEKGYRIPKESFTEGELVATKGHLQDLRKLLKL